MTVQVSVEEQLETLEKEIIQVLTAAVATCFTRVAAELGVECRRQGVLSEEQRTRKVVCMCCNSSYYWVTKDLQVNWALLRLEIKGKEINEESDDLKRREVIEFERCGPFRRSSEDKSFLTGMRIPTSLIWSRFFCRLRASCFCIYTHTS
jgi:hypothetical protein